MRLKALSIVGYLGMIVGLLGLLATSSLFSPSPLVIVPQILALLLLVWARLTFGRRSLHFAANPTEGGLVTTAPLGVKSAMKPAYVLLVGFAAFLAACAPPSKLEAGRATEPPRPNADLQELRRAAANMASLVTDLQGTRSQVGSGAGQSAGNLWMEVNRLKRGGQNVRQIEWYVCDLEGSLLDAESLGTSGAWNGGSGGARTRNLCRDRAAL